VVVAEAHKRIGSRIEEGRHYRGGPGLKAKVQRGSEACENEDVTPRQGNREGNRAKRGVFPSPSVSLADLI
jgi:hypothetical protein